jgi:hypothetical protein
MPDNTPSSNIQVLQPRKKTLKIVIIVFGLFLLVVISELGYYFYTANKRNAAQQEAGITTPSSGTVQLQTEKALGYAESLDASPGDFVTEAVMRIGVEGKVVSVDNTDKAEGAKQYVSAIFLEDKNGISGRWYFTQEEVDSAEVYLLDSSGNKRAISFSEIAPGDFIVSTETVDLLDPSEAFKIVLNVTRK